MERFVVSRFVLPVLFAMSLALGGRDLVAQQDSLPATSPQSSPQQVPQPASQPAPETRTVAGTVTRPVRLATDTTISSRPVPGVWVAVHRVGRDSAGALDSVRTDASGAYRLSFRTFGDDAIYFAAVSYNGLAYFTPPIRSALVTGEQAQITVFDTTSGPLPIAVRGRHLIVGSIDTTGFRTVIEVYELENDSLRTLITSEGPNARPTWSAAIPLAAIDHRINDTEVSKDAATFRDGRALFFAPFAPGLRQLSFSYRIRATDFPVVFTAEYPVDVFEVLLEDSQGSVVNEHFTATNPVTLEGRTFRRLLAQNIEPGERVIVELPMTPGVGRNMYIAALLVLLGLVMMVMLLRAMSKRSANASAINAPRIVIPADTVSELPLTERLAHEIAALDAVYARNANPSDAVREAYENRRAELKSALAAALADSTARR